MVKVLCKWLMARDAAVVDACLAHFETPDSIPNTARKHIENKQCGTQSPKVEKTPLSGALCARPRKRAIVWAMRGFDLNLRKGTRIKLLQVSFWYL